MSKVKKTGKCKDQVYKEQKVNDWAKMGALRTVVHGEATRVTEYESRLQFAH